METASLLQIGAAFSADGRVFARIPADESPYSNTSLSWCEGCNVSGLVLWGRDVFPGLSGVADGLVADPDLAVDDAGVIHAFFSSMPVDKDGNVRRLQCCFSALPPLLTASIALCRSSLMASVTRLRLMGCLDPLLRQPSAAGGGALCDSRP